MFARGEVRGDTHRVSDKNALIIHMSMKKGMNFTVSSVTRDSRASPLREELACEKRMTEEAYTESIPT